MRTITRQNVEFQINSPSYYDAFWNLTDWEEYNYKLIKELSVNHKVFVNAGGWVGPFTLYAGKLFDRVYTLEPDTVAFDELKKNVEVNNYTNVSIYNIAFFNNTTSNITIGVGNWKFGDSGTSIFHSRETVNVPCVTLRDFFESNNIPERALLQLDVEGAEYVLFEDFEFFAKFKPTIILEVHARFMSDDNYNHFKTCVDKLSEIYKVKLEDKFRDGIYSVLFEYK